VDRNRRVRERKRALAENHLELPNGIPSYVLALKGNQGTLAKEVQETFTLAQADHFTQIQHQFYQTLDKGHGRLEIRKNWIIDDSEHVAYLNPKGK